MSRLNLAKNTSFFTLALAFQKALAFGYFIIIARSLGVIDTGRYSFAMSFTTIFAMLLDFGLTQVLIRESAKNNDEGRKYLSTVLALKLIGALVIYGALIASAFALNYPPELRQLIYISGVIMIVDSFATSFYGVLRGQQNLLFESLGVIGNQLLVMATGVFVIWMQLGVRYVIAAYLVGSTFNLLLSVTTLWRRYHWPLRPHFDWQYVKKLLLLAAPFAVAGLFMRIYGSIDMVFLSKMSSEHDLGIYSVAYKVSFALQFIGTAFSASVYPAFCRYVHESSEKLSQTFVESIRYLTILSLPLAAGVVVLAPVVLVPVFGSEYQEALEPLSLMMMALVFAFIAYPLTSLLNAAHKQTRNTIHLGITALTNAVLNAFFIPLWSYNGAAAATLISYFVLVALSFVAASKIVAYPKRIVVGIFIRVLISTAVMAVVILVLRDLVPVVLVIPIAGICYVAMLYIVKGFTTDDIRQLKQMLSR